MSLYDIDDLQAVIARNRKVRQAEARKAEGIIEEEIQHFATWLGSLEVLPTIAALRDARDRDRRAGAARERRQVGGGLARATSSGSTRWRARSSTALLHDPTARLKELRDDRVHARAAMVRDLFGLEGDDGRLLELPEIEEQLAPGGRSLSAAAADADRNARERAGARAGRVGGASGSAPTPRSSRSPPRVTAERRSGTSRAGCPSSSARCSTDGSTSPCTRPRTCPTQLAEGLELVAIPERADPRDAICGARSLAELAAGRHASAPAACGARPRSAPSAATSRWSACAATSTPGCASSPRVSSTRSCSRSRGSSGSAARTRPVACSTSSCPRPVRARSRSRRVPERSRPSCWRRSSDPEATACVTAERELVACARCLLQHAGRRSRPPAGRAASSSSSPGWDCPTARHGFAIARRGDAAGLGRALAQRLLSAGAGELLRRAEQEASVV